VISSCCATCEDVDVPVISPLLECEVGHSGPARTYPECVEERGETVANCVPVEADWYRPALKMPKHHDHTTVWQLIHELASCPPCPDPVGAFISGDEGVARRRATLARQKLRCGMKE
jgi:hypothetical protein